jgi:hypothetical protein
LEDASSYFLELEAADERELVAVACPSHGVHACVEAVAGLYSERGFYCLVLGLGQLVVLGDALEQTGHVGHPYALQAGQAAGTALGCLLHAADCLAHLLGEVDVADVPALPILAAAALKAAREHTDPAFVNELIQMIDDNDPHSAMALSALAYSDARDASTKVTQVAYNESTDRRLRKRAIALLAVDKDPKVRPLLAELAAGSDPSCARLANEVFKAFD